MIAAAQTRPEDAISNLAGWLKLFGVDHAPAFLNTLQADAWATALGSLVALGSAIVWAWARQDKKLKPASGVWLYGEGLEHMKVSREASTPFASKFFPLPQDEDGPASEPSQREPERQARRRSLIDAGRNIAFGYTYEKPEGGFRAYLEGQRAYSDIRPHLSQGYLAKLNAQRMLYAKADGARLETLVQWFLDEIDRLEREWNLT